MLAYVNPELCFTFLYSYRVWATAQTVAASRTPITEILRVHTSDIIVRTCIQAVFTALLFFNVDGEYETPSEPNILKSAFNKRCEALEGMV
jgi:hypothetical protein